MTTTALGVWLTQVIVMRETSLQTQGGCAGWGGGADIEGAGVEVDAGQ